MNRRQFVLGAAALAAAATFHGRAEAKVATPYGPDLTPPMDEKENFVKWMAENRGEDPVYLGRRWDRYRVILNNRDITTLPNERAFLLTPREAFVLSRNLKRAYDSAFLDIGYGVTISGPHLVARMTSSIDVRPGDKVLEVGTGSGYQSAYLSHLTDKVWSVEIIEPLAARTRKLYDDLIAEGYNEFQSIATKAGDGYYGWEEEAPFDRIIVTCGIDHIPPPLLRQLKPGGIMVIPVGPPGAQHVLKVVKEEATDGSLTVARSDIYNGRIVPFVPFTKLEDGVIKGSHNKG